MGGWGRQEYGTGYLPYRGSVQLPSHPNPAVQGRAAYLASTAHGVTSSSYGGWSHSFKFRGPALPASVECDQSNNADSVVSSSR